MFDISKLRVDGKVKLDEIDPQETIEWDGDRAEAEARTAVLNDRLEELQELLYAEGKHKVLFWMPGWGNSTAWSGPTAMPITCMGSTICG